MDRSAELGDASQSGVSGGMGQTDGSPDSGSRRIPDAKPDAAAFGAPGRTLIVGSRTVRPSTKPFRE